MSLPSTIVQGARNLGAAVAFNATAHSENEMRKAGALPEILCLIGEGELALYFGNQALTTLGQQAVPTANGWAPIVIPSILVLGEAVLPDGYAKATVGFLKTKLGMLLQASVVVSQIALVYFTGSSVAIAVLSYMAIDALHSRKLLPSRISWAYQWVQFPLALTLAALANGTWTAIALFTAFMVAIYVVPKLLLRAIGTQPDPKGNTGQLTPAILQDILQKDNPFQDFEINLAHLAWSALPPQPNVELSELLELWDQIPWEKYPPDAIIAPAANPRAKIEKFIQKLEGRPWERDLYQTKVVITHLKDKATEAERAKFLSKLAACSEFGFQYIISDLSDRVVAGNKKLSLRTGILNYLQQMRMDRRFMVSGMITSLREARFPVNIGALYGLVRHQHEIYRPELQIQGMWKYFGKEMRDDLTRGGYVPESLARSVELQYSGNPLIRSWWHTFISRQSAENQTKFCQLLASAQIPRMRRADWEQQMNHRSEMMKNPLHRSFLGSQPPLPASNLEFLDLINVRTHRPKTSLRGINLDFLETEIGSIEITSKVILAMLFEMGILQRKTKLASQIREKRIPMPRLSKLVDLQVENQNLRAQLEPKGIVVPPPQPVVPRPRAAPSVSIGLPPEPFAMPPMPFNPMGGMPDEQAMMQMGQQMFANMTPAQKAQMKSMMTAMGMPEDEFAAMEAEMAALNDQGRDEKSASVDDVD